MGEKPEKITSKEIAKLAGVSVSTVSIVLNNKSGVSQETRDRVTAILNAHGIVPREPTNVSNGSRKTLQFCKIVKHGGIINERHNVFLSDYIDGVIQKANELGYSVQVTTYQNIALSHIVSQLETAPDISGCVLLGTELAEEDLDFFGSLSIPHVFLDTNYPCRKGMFVTMDNHKMVTDAMDHLVANGHRHIGMLLPTGAANFFARYQAFTNYMKRKDLPLDEKDLVPVKSTLTGAYESMKAFLKTANLKALPTAFFACNDIIAIGAIRALQEKGIRVPEQVSVIGFDDLPASALINPALTTMSVPKIRIGGLAVQMLIHNMNMKGEFESSKSELGGSLIVRNSVRSLVQEAVE